MESKESKEGQESKESKASEESKKSKPPNSPSTTTTAPMSPVSPTISTPSFSSSSATLIDWWMTDNDDYGKAVQNNFSSCSFATVPQHNKTSLSLKHLISTSFSSPAKRKLYFSNSCMSPRMSFNMEERFIFSPTLVQRGLQKNQQYKVEHWFQSNLQRNTSTYNQHRWRHRY